MAGQSANETRGEIAKRLSNLECSYGKSKGGSETPHGKDKYAGGKVKKDGGLKK